MNTPWPFVYDPSDTMICLKRILAGQAEVKYVLHDPEGGYQFLDGEDVEDDDAAVVPLNEIIANDPTLMTVACLPQGFAAFRESVNEPWAVFFDDEDEDEDEAGGDD
jgi:hypothetical protein